MSINVQVVTVFRPLTGSITQVVCLHAHIQMYNISVQMENVVEVTQRQWTVKPAHSKHHKRNAQPRNLITLSQNLEGKPDLPPCGLAGTHTANGDIIDLSNFYVARPSHQQDPHTGTYTAYSQNGIGINDMRG